MYKSYLNTRLLLCSIGIILLIICCQKHPKTFEFYISKSDSCYFLKNYLIAGKYADSAFMVQEGTKNTYYNAACCWALSDNRMKAFEYLMKAIDMGYININWFVNDSDLKSLHNSIEWNELLNILRQNIQDYESTLNVPLKNEIEIIGLKDQMLRKPNLIDSIRTNYGPDSKEMGAFIQNMIEIDSLNLSRITEIIDTYGWPGKSIVGEEANHIVWLVVQHSDIEIQEKYLPLLRESVRNNESSAKDLAFLEDRILVNNNQPQLYGTQVVCDSNNNCRFAEIENEKKVNKRRSNIGLGTIEDYARSMHIEYKTKK